MEQEPQRAEKKGRDLVVHLGTSLGPVMFVSFLILCPIWFLKSCPHYFPWETSQQYNS